MRAQVWLGGGGVCVSPHPHDYLDFVDGFATIPLEILNMGLCGTTYSAYKK